MNVELFGYRTRNETFFKGNDVNRQDVAKIYAYCPRYGGMVSSDKFDWIDQNGLQFSCPCCGTLHKVEVGVCETT